MVRIGSIRKVKHVYEVLKPISVTYEPGAVVELEFEPEQEVVLLEKGVLQRHISTDSSEVDTPVFEDEEEEEDVDYG